MPRYDNNNRNHMTYYEYKLGYTPVTNEEMEAANREIEIMNELEGLAYNSRLGERSASEVEQEAALKRMVLPGPSGSSLKEEILAYGISPKKVKQALIKRGNDLTTNEVFNTLQELYEGGPVVEGVGRGYKPPRRSNRFQRKVNPILTMKKHLRPRNFKRGAVMNLGPNIAEHYKTQARIKELESQLQGLNRRGGRRKTRRTRRRN